MAVRKNSLIPGTRAMKETTAYMMTDSENCLGIWNWVESTHSLHRLVKLVHQATDDEIENYIKTLVM